MKIFCYTLSILLFAPAYFKAAPEQSPWAFIDTIDGRPTLESNSDKPIVLNPNTDRGRILKSGERLNCLNGVVKGVTIDMIGSDALKAPVNLCQFKVVSDRHDNSGKLDQNKAAIAFDKYYARAGRDKGSESPIYAPPDHGSVLADKFIVRWRTRPPLGKFNAILQDGNTEVARVSDVDGATGILDSPVLRQALDKYRGSSVPNHQLQIIFKFEGNSDQSAAFTVLTRKQEEQLNKDVAALTSEVGLFRYVQQAAVYDSFRLFGMVAAEYDAALDEAPQSRDLLQAALDAHARIGDLHRARELRDKLKQVEETDKN